MNREQILLRRIKLLTWLFIIGLVLSGATAIPLQVELNWLASFFKIFPPGASYCEKPGGNNAERFYSAHSQPTESSTAKGDSHFQKKAGRSCDRPATTKNKTAVD